MPGEERAVCPVCDNEIPKDSRKCPNCGVDLSLFDLEVDVDHGSPEEINNIIQVGEDEEELIEKIKDLGGNNNGEGVEMGEGEVADEDVEEAVTFECPICEAEVDEDASECPSCGAIFVE